MGKEREGFKAVSWWLPSELVQKLSEYRHYRRLGTVTDAARILLEDGLRRWEADPDEMPLAQDRPAWRYEADEWRDRLLTRFVEEMRAKKGLDYTTRTVEKEPPYVSALVRPPGASSHFDLRAVVDLRQNGLVELRVEARFADMHEGSERRQRAERDVDALLDPNRSLLPVFDPKPGETQFKRQRLLQDPLPFAERPDNDWIIQRFIRTIDALDQCLAPAVRRYYQ